MLRRRTATEEKRRLARVGAGQQQKKAETEQQSMDQPQGGRGMSIEDMLRLYGQQQLGSWPAMICWARLMA